MTGKPRILFLSQSGELTGPAKSLLFLLRHIKEKFEVSVLFPGEKGAFEDKLKDLGIRSFQIRNGTKWGIPGMMKILYREKIDLVYANTSMGIARNTCLASRML